MRLVKPSVEIVTQAPGFDGMEKQIEKVGRICYKSELNIKEGSAHSFVESLIKRGHLAPLEHGTLYLKIPVFSKYVSGNFTEDYISDASTLSAFLCENKYSRANYVSGADESYIIGYWYITTNYRVIIENGLDVEKVKQFMVDYDDNFERRVAVKYISQIIISREANRHRVNSMMGESTRYCNYSNGRFGSSLSISVPHIIPEDQIESLEAIDLETAYKNFGLLHKIANDPNRDKSNDTKYRIELWAYSILLSEAAYMDLISFGLKPEDARTVIPICTNNEFIHTAFVSDWEHFFELRCDKAAHPDIRSLAQTQEMFFIELGYKK